MSSTMIADWRVFPKTEAIEAAAIGDGAVAIGWSDGRRSPYHFAWLRDNCPCDTCVHRLTREQVFEIVDAPSDLAPLSVAVDAEGDLAVRWPDGHRSLYAPGWLRAHAYDDASRAERRKRATPWTSDRASDLPMFEHAAIMGDGGTLLAWLTAMRDFGLTLVRGVPAEPGEVGRVANRISFIRETNFGVLFDVQSKPEPDSNAYTSINLPLHTDLPTRELQPGVQLLHCLANEVAGGDSLFVDGLAIAAALRDEHPDDFAVLTTMPVEFRNKDHRTDYRHRAPIILLDHDGAVVEVRVANFLRGPFDAPAAVMPALYRAYRNFLQHTRDPRFVLRRRLGAGDMWGFDNRRILHARTEFDPAGGNRHLQGCYIDRDELLSRIRVLERERA